MCCIQLQVEVQAFNESDMKEAVGDTFGPGEICGLRVVESEIIEYDEL
jgi:hypothetical protein